MSPLTADVTAPKILNTPAMIPMASLNRAVEKFNLDLNPNSFSQLSRKGYLILKTKGSTEK
jgi:hypothetical protein